MISYIQENFEQYFSGYIAISYDKKIFKIAMLISMFFPWNVYETFNPQSWVSGRDKVFLGN